MKLLYKILLILSFSFSFGQSSVCDTAEAMCSGNQGPFNNLSGQPNNNSLGCLGTTPNRAWFYMQVGTSGTMNFQLSQISTGGAGIDVDFILWGPFNSLTGICNNLALYSPGYVGSNNVVACSYSTAAVENFTIPNAVAGQYYMLLVTNYRDLPGTYTLNQTGGSGALSCDIVCGVTLGPDRILCGTSSSVTLNANFLQAPSLQGSPIYTWYLNDVQQFTTPTNSTTVNQSGTWKVSVTRPGCSDVATDEVEVQFIGVVPFNNIGPIATPAGQCNPIIDLTSYQSALVAPYDPVSFVFVYYDGSGNVIANPSTFSPTTSTTIAIEIIAGPCSNFDTVGIVVDCVPPTCNLTLTSASSTTNQIVCLGSPLTNIVYSSTGTVSNVTVSGLPTGLTSSYSNQVFTITGTPTQTGIFNYTVSTVGCTTNDTKSGTIRVIEVPTVPTTSQVAPTCDAPTTTTISNYSNAVTYIFSPTGPSVASSGVVSGMVVGTSYTVSATNGTCPTSPSGSFVNNAQLTLPLTPAISIATPTCSSNGIATISNYVSGLNYTFTPTGPTVSSTGVVSGMNVGQNYVVLANNGSCSSSNTSSFMIESRLPAPVAPSITNTNPTCNASGTSTISNYNSTFSYSFAPTGPTILSGGQISGMAVGTSYVVSVTSPSISCPSTSSSFSNAAQLITPSAPTLTVLDDLICFGETAVFQISGMPGSNVTYSINNGSSQSVTLTNQGTASVEIVDSSDTVNIELLSISNGNCTFNFSDSDAVSIQLCDIPKGVSPNGDGLNDTWDLGGYNVKKVEIFNRYGTKVYSKSNYVDEWHGQSDNSNELPDGTYYYVVEFNDSPVKTGWVYINREQ
jgi:gliding motility-associated-like protein